MFSCTNGHNIARNLHGYGDGEHIIIIIKEKERILK